MKYKVLFSLKNNKKVLINVVCCALRVNNKLNLYHFIHLSALMLSPKKDVSL